MRQSYLSWGGVVNSYLLAGESGSCRASVGLGEFPLLDFVCPPRWESGDPRAGGDFPPSVRLCVGSSDLCIFLRGHSPEGVFGPTSKQHEERTVGFLWGLGGLSGFLVVCGVVLGLWLGLVCFFVGLKLLV